jgi:hypothetical protein
LLSVEAADISFIAVDLTGPAIRPLTYQTHGEHTFYNTTEVVEAVIKQGYNGVRVGVMVFNATFNNTSAISWRSVLLVEETEVPGENH